MICKSTWAACRCHGVLRCPAHTGEGVHGRCRQRATAPAGSRFANEFRVFRGAHADPMVPHTQNVSSCIGTGIRFYFKNFMRIPIKSHTSCVSGSIESACVSRGPLKFKKVLVNLPRNPCGSYGAAHAKCVKLGECDMQLTVCKPRRRQIPLGWSQDPR